MKKSDRKHVNWTLRGADNDHYSSLILVLFFCVCVFGQFGKSLFTLDRTFHLSDFTNADCQTMQNPKTDKKKKEY